MTDPTPEPVALGRHWPKLFVSLLLAGGFVWLLHAGALPLVPERGAFENVTWSLVAVHILMWSAMHVIRASRWYWLLLAVQHVPMRTVMRTSFVAYAAIVLMPFRMGEVLRPLLIQRDGKISPWAATGTVGAERVVDGLVVSLLLLVALTLAEPVPPVSDQTRLVSAAAYGFVGLFAVAFVLMSLFYWQRRWARRASEALLGLVSLRFARWFAGRVEQVADGLSFLRNARAAVPFAIGTALYWGINGVSWWVLGLAAGMSDFTFVQALATMGVLAIGITIPNTPGFFGQFQFAIYAALAMYMQKAEVEGPGAVYVLLTYVNQVGITLGLGALATLVSPHARSADSPPDPSSAAAD